MVVPAFREQLDALGTVAQLVLDFEFKRDPTETLKRLTAEKRAAFSWLEDKLKEFPL